MSNLVDRDTLRKREDAVAARFQKIELRWEKRRRKRPKFFSWERQRLRDLQIILQDRYPDGVPADINIDDLVRETAQILGDSLGLTAKERAMRKITTIRPCDQTVEERATVRKAKKRDAQRARRKAAGATPREQSLSRTKPWTLAGMSRAQWYRVRQVRGVRQIRADHLSSTARHEAVSPLNEPASLGPTLNPASWPALPALGYLLRLAEYRRLTSGGIVRAVPGLAACSELRRVA